MQCTINKKDKLIPETIGERIRLFRTKKGLTQEEFLKKINVSRPTLVSYERGRVEPKLLFVKEWHDVYKVSYEYILGEESLEDSEARNIKDNKAAIFAKYITSEFEHILNKLSIEQQRKIIPLLVNAIKLQMEMFLTVNKK